MKVVGVIGVVSLVLLFFIAVLVEVCYFIIKFVILVLSLLKVEFLEGLYMCLFWVLGWDIFFVGVVEGSIGVLGYG